MHEEKILIHICEELTYRRQTNLSLSLSHTTCPNPLLQLISDLTQQEMMEIFLLFKILLENFITK